MRLRTASTHSCSVLRDAVTADLVEITAGANKVVSRAWEAVNDELDESAARLAVWRACAPGASPLGVEAAMELTKRVEDAARDATRRWHGGVALALRQETGAAHRWANAVNAMTAEVTAPNSNEPIEVAQYHTDQWADECHAHSTQAADDPVAVIRELRERSLGAKGHAQIATLFIAVRIMQAFADYEGHLVNSTAHQAEVEWRGAPRRRDEGDWG